MTQIINISDGEYEKFRDYFYHKTGLFFNDSKRYFVDKRIIERILETGYGSFKSYFAFLRFQESEEEFHQLISLMTVHETYFFREEYQLQCMVNHVLDEISDHKKENNLIRIWSIPCSTGEEPYSIAIYLLERWPKINHIDVELVASDIDLEVLEWGKGGLYSNRSVQYLPADILSKYFERQRENQYQLSTNIRSAVQFTQVNINNLRQTRSYINFDIIFCRNLLIYFDDVSRKKTVNTLYDLLNPGGFVFLGHSESMSRTTSLFNVRRYSEGIVYQKPIELKRGRS